VATTFLYFFDSLLFIFYQDFLGIVIHVIALVQIFMDWRANKKILEEGLINQSETNLSV